MSFTPDMLLLYVDDVDRSAAFYRSLFGKGPVQASPSFALFILDTIKLGLWQRPDVEPAAKVTGGGCEVAIAVEDKARVDALAEEWAGRGITIAQKPKEMSFGYTFVGLDPDGHRLRIFHPSRR